MTPQPRAAAWGGEGAAVIRLDYVSDRESGDGSASGGTVWAELLTSYQEETQSAGAASKDSGLTEVPEVVCVQVFETCWTWAV